MVVHIRQPAVGLQNALLDLGQERKAERVAGAKDNVVDVLDLGLVLEGDGAGFVTKVYDLLLDGNVRVRERLPAEVRDGLASEGGVNWMLGDGEDLVEELMRRYGSSYYNDFLETGSVPLMSADERLKSWLTLPLYLSEPLKCLLCTIRPGNLSSYSAMPLMFGNQGTL